MVDLRESNRDRELAVLLDVSTAGNSSQACQLVDEFVERLAEHPPGILVDINAGDLLLTKGVLTKVKQQILRSGALLGTIYSTVPQTQQAALDDGLYVKEKLATEWTPLRQPLPKMAKENLAATPPAAPALSAKKAGLGVDLPDFRQPRPAARPVEDFIPMAPQNENVLDLDVVEVEPPPPSGEIPSALQGGGVDGEEASPQEVDLPETAFDTMYLRQTLRSGQTVRFNGNIVIVGDVHAGSEVTAGGDIVVWGELRGIAHAGAQGNYKSEIRAMKIEALQLRIADYIARRPDRIYYHKDGLETQLSPEVARVADGEIKIFRTMLPKG